jgi:hypothetical protein
MEEKAMSECTECGRWPVVQHAPEIADDLDEEDRCEWCWLASTLNYWFEVGGIMVDEYLYFCAHPWHEWKCRGRPRGSSLAEYIGGQ